ncbi:MAG TPA: methyltransferase domain-containing protein [Bryobacterales bacterium]|nr:methyltransferase domain-containing protein [Bryobacterales bacterium]
MTARPYIPELLDIGSASPQEVSRALADLRRINRWLGGSGVLLGLLAAEVRRAKLERFSFLDVGAGSGDLGAAVARRFPSARVVLCDLKPQHFKNDALARLAASAERLPFQDGSFDFVGASLLLHQFRDPDVVSVLRAFGRTARRAVLINDLERHWFPLLFIRLAAPVFARSYVTRHDAPASIRQAFRPQELREFARAAGFRDVVVRRHWPWFRLSLVARSYV